MLEWDGAAGRELGEWLIGVIGRASELPAPHAFAKPEELKDAGGAVLVVHVERFRTCRRDRVRQAATRAQAGHPGDGGGAEMRAESTHGELLGVA